ncbi:hypothetical protein SAMN02745219_00057 [Desulfofundulus thermosubterraneus DSM 16057]|uniref:Uncharacterized protein n=1 Tax=Desulfofundulus thermosubterraneus DSM 16057 TaxID=1121432 RepID=A0A1M6A8U9_9FIRM|nr:hypothetical protein SAMN02745219_00057 [Desulfofundulus thermosubterraneus DSM 16057]
MPDNKILWPGFDAEKIFITCNLPAGAFQPLSNLVRGGRIYFGKEGLEDDLAGMEKTVIGISGDS